MRRIEEMLNRLRAEFMEMPGMRLTLEQVRRLCGVERGLCQTMLDSLVGAHFLCVTADGQYARVTDGEMCPARRTRNSDPTRVLKHRDGAPNHVSWSTLNVLAMNVGDGSRWAERAGCLMTTVKSDKSNPTIPSGVRDAQATTRAAMDWHIARAHRVHVLVTGAAEAVELSLAALMPHLNPPVCYWPHGTLLPSPWDVESLVIRNVDALSSERQRDLLSWLDQAAVAPTRVVSTTTVPLFERVAAGLFLDALYYRLNTLMLHGAPDGADHPHPHPAKANLGTGAHSLKAS
jgi:hypothetical protein